jgi:N-acetylglucosamine kinase-like BadF-type ATPase
MKRIIMGVDGGGTKSHLALFCQDGECLKFKTFGTLNHECMDGSYSELEAVLPEFLQSSVKEAGVCINDITYSVLGLAGVDTKAQHELISAILRKAGLVNFTLCNDAYLGVAAGCPGGAGICAINGTGSTMAALDYSGNEQQLGGLGILTDDCGGSTWYSEQLLSAVFNSLFKCEELTLMTEALFERLGVSHKDDYLETLSARLYNDIDINDLNRLVFEAAGKNDKTALNILERSAKHYAGGIAYLAREMDFPQDKPLQITFAGSVFVKEQVKILPQLIEERVRKLLGTRSVELNTLDSPPVTGAVLWAAREAGFGDSFSSSSVILP